MCVPRIWYNWINGLNFVFQLLFLRSNRLVLVVWTIFSRYILSEIFVCDNNSTLLFCYNIMIADRSLIFSLFLFNRTRKFDEPILNDLKSTIDTCSAPLKPWRFVFRTIWSFEFITTIGCISCSFTGLSLRDAVFAEQNRRQLHHYDSWTLWFQCVTAVARETYWNEPNTNSRTHECTLKAIKVIIYRRCGRCGLLVFV